MNLKVGEFKVTHEATVKYRWSLSSHMASVVARFCICEGLTDTLSEYNDHLVGRGLVGQKLIHKNLWSSWFGYTSTFCHLHTGYNLVFTSNIEKLYLGLLFMCYKYDIEEIINISGLSSDNLFLHYLLSSFAYKLWVRIYLSFVAHDRPQKNL